MKKTILRLLEFIYPELKNKMHLPRFARVIAIADPPVNGGFCNEVRPGYAVSIQLLNESFADDGDLPPIPDVPVALPCGGQTRGLSALPQPGTIVEVAFAYGSMRHPFVRAVLPYGLNLGINDGNSMRLQHNPLAYLEIKPLESSLIAPTIWIGSPIENTLAIHSEFMAAVATAMLTIAEHTHPKPGDPPDSKDALKSQASAITAQKTRINVITKRNVSTKERIE